MSYRTTSRTTRRNARRLHIEHLEDRRLLAVFTVDNLDDAGAGSLRQAVLDANADAIADDIEFMAGLSGTIALTSGQLAITNPVTITGPGAETLTIDAGGSSRIFNVSDGSAALIDVTISGLTLIGGFTTQDGGAINSLENLTVTDSVITGNNADDDGAGIKQEGGSLTVSATAIDNNLSTGAFAQGTGIYARDANVAIADSTISGNFVLGSNTVARGGGVMFVDSIGGKTLLVERSSFVGNNAQNGGGGLFVMGGEATITDSEFRGNFAEVNGGAIFVNGGNHSIERTTIDGNSTSAGSGGGVAMIGGSLVIDSSTLSNNVAGGIGRGGAITHQDGPITIINSTLSGNEAEQGGAIRAVNNTLTISHSTVANNVARNSAGGLSIAGTVNASHLLLADNRRSNGTADDHIGTLNANFSLITTPGTVNGANNLLSIDPLLLPLADNGGPTQTHAVPAHLSPAINAGDAAIASPPTFDQRGAGFPRVEDGRIDIGALEVEASILPPPSLAVSTTTDVIDGDYGSGQLSLREAVLLAHSAAFPGADVITFDPALTATADATIQLTQVGDDSNGDSAFLISSEITIEGPLGDHGVTIARDAGAADMRLFFVESGGSLTVENLTLDGGSSSGVLRNDGVVNIIRSTVTGADGVSATALYNDGQMSVQSSTISGNRNAIINGGGGGTSLDIAHSTVTNNTGAGLYNDGGQVDITHSIIAGNALGDVVNAVSSGGFNLIGDGDAGSGFVATDLVGTSGSPIDPVLGALADNGGPTRLHVPLSSSPAIDAGDPSFTGPPDFDQRGAGFPRVVGPSIDIGAVEQQAGVAFATTMMQVTEHAPLPITLIRTGDLSSQVSVTVEFIDGTAIGAAGGAGADFDNTPITVHFAVDQASQAVPLPITIDALLEPAESFVLELTAADSSVLGNPRFATVTIFDARVFVTTAMDEDDGSTDPTLGTGTSLREAVAAANAVAGVQTIVFDPAVFATPQTMLLTEGELEVTESLNVTGLGREFVTIDAQQQSRIFNFTATTGDFSLQSLSLMGGRTTVAGDAGRGGAVRAATSGTVTLDDVHLFDNETRGVGAHGGGISASGVLNISGSTVSGNATRTQGGHGGGAHAVGNLSVSESVIHNNLATRADGGGLFSSISVVATDSVLSSNSVTEVIPAGSDFARFPVGSGHGGAITVGVSGGSSVGTTIELIRTKITDNVAFRSSISAHRGAVLVVDSSITENRALAGTAGIATGWFAPATGGPSLSGSVMLHGATISENIVTGQHDAESGAGAIVTRNATIVNSTITGNLAVDGQRLFDLDVFHVLAGATISVNLTMRNSIVAGNTTVPDHDPLNGPGGRDMLFSSALLQNSFIGSVGRLGSGTPLPSATGPTTPDANGNFIGSPTVPLNQPPLGLFSDNGGGQWIDGTPILTYLPLEGGVLIDGGHPDDMAGVGNVPLYDSRGEPFSRVIGGRIDMGAVEFDRFTLQVDLPQDGLADDVTLRRNGDQIEVFDNNAGVLLHSELLSQLTAVEINGVANEDDRLHVDFAFGGFFHLQHGIQFNGGTGGTDLLEITGTGMSLGVYRDGPVPGASTIDVTSGAESIAIHSISVEPQTIRDLLNFQFDGVLAIGSEILTLDLPVFARLGSVTTIAGGQIVAPGGLTLDVGSLLQGAGSVAAPIAAQTGSTIKATGDLVLGDANAFNGFFSDGVLDTGPHAVTIHDQDRAVLGSLTVLGNAIGPGLLHAPGGLLNEDGKTIAGYGVVTADLRNQGLVHGEGPDPLDLIELAGTVTGRGSYSGRVAFSGVFSPGDSPTRITVNGDIILADSNRLVIELGGLNPGQEYDVVNVSGELTLGGVLEVSRLNLGNGYQFELGDQFTVLESANMVGELRAIVGLGIDDDLRLEPVFSSTTLVLAVVPAHELLLGDYNRDGLVSASDYVLWRNSEGDTVTPFAGADGNGNGLVDQADYQVWRENFGSMLPPPALGASSVVELALVETALVETVNDGDAQPSAAVTAGIPAIVRRAGSASVRDLPVRYVAQSTPTSLDEALLVLLAHRTAPTNDIGARIAASTSLFSDDEMECKTGDGLLSKEVDVAIVDW